VKPDTLVAHGDRRTKRKILCVLARTLDVVLANHAQ
jgi:hypothetical protein